MKHHTQSETSLLQYGLKFIPTKKRVDVGQLLADIRQWERKMCLRELYYDRNKKDDLKVSDMSKQEEVEKEMEARTRNKTYMPPTGRDCALDLYTEFVKEDIVKGIKPSGKMNISLNEEEALSTLMHDESIIIRPADKGFGIVIMNSDDYTQEVEDELENNSSYMKVPDDRTNMVANKVKKMAERLQEQGWISPSMKQYLNIPEPQAGK